MSPNISVNLFTLLPFTVAVMCCIYIALAKIRSKQEEGVSVSPQPFELLSSVIAASLFVALPLSVAISLIALADSLIN